MKWSIEAAGDGFSLSRGDVTLSIPATLGGLRALHSVLMNWEPEQKIATPGFPTQSQLAEIIKHFQRTVLEPQFKLDLGDLDL